VQRAPGIPHALCFQGGEFCNGSDALRRGNAEVCVECFVIASEVKQSIAPQKKSMASLLAMTRQARKARAQIETIAKQIAAPTQENKPIALTASISRWVSENRESFRVKAAIVLSLMGSARSCAASGIRNGPVGVCDFVHTGRIGGLV
jgi:hypothetical protein